MAVSRLGEEVTPCVSKHYNQPTSSYGYGHAKRSTDPDPRDRADLADRIDEGRPDLAFEHIALVQ